MVIDTSALVAVLQGEVERASFLEAISESEDPCLSTASFLEVSMIIESRLGPEGIRDLDLFLAKADITLVPFDGEQAEIARKAFKRFGKGRHPAGLNFGDCFSYALAKSKGEPLLFKGDDFSRTDIPSVISG